MPFLKVKTNDTWVPVGWTEQVVDDALSTTSINPVQNKVVSSAIATLTELTETDTKVTQTITTTNANYPLLLAPSGQSDTTTTTSYFDSGVTLNPSTNTIAANVSGSSASIQAESLAGLTVSLDDYTLSSGTPHIKYYCCRSDWVGSNITGRPDSTLTAFNLRVELIRWSSTTDYITKQTYTRGSERVSWERFCISGTWGSWRQIAYTDSSISGNAATATKLATARTLTIGNTGKSFDGSANASWTLSEIGAATKPTVLFSSDTGDNTSETITLLTDDVSNYDRIEIIYGLNWNTTNVAVCIPALSKRVAMSVIYAGNDFISTTTGVCVLKENQLIRGTALDNMYNETANRERRIMNNYATDGTVKITSTIYNATEGFGIYIYRVIGYKD